MSIKQYLRKTIDDRIGNLEAAAEQERAARELIKEVDMRKGDYTVILNNLWADEGGDSVTRKHTGTVKNAIQLAEKEFLDINSRSDVQAEYTVRMSIGPQEYDIPQKFWARYMLKHQ